MAQFKPGESGNPGGRRKDSHIKDLLHPHTPAAAQKLVELMSSSTSATVQFNAANAILDRVFGKPVQASEGQQLRDGWPVAEGEQREGRSARDRLLELVNRAVAAREEEEREEEERRPERRFSRNPVEPIHLKTGLGEDSEPSRHGGH